MADKKPELTVEEHDGKPFLCVDGKPTDYEVVHYEGRRFFNRIFDPYSLNSEFEPIGSKIEMRIVKARGIQKDQETSVWP
tara:strand:+ start:2167 stop:2406 length:240 start_codon:yes stop_codon:yes gene_type:complete